MSANMKTYNVAVTVVELVDANSADESVQALEKRLRAAGFETLEFSGNAFESEDQSD